MSSLVARKSSSLKGIIKIPGDKSISHRAIIIGSISTGVTNVKGLLESEDVHSTIKAFRKMGAKITKKEDNIYEIKGVGLGGLVEPDDVLDMGNSGTSARLIMGVVSGHPISAIFTGDDSLRKRPMNRIIEPLSLMGASFDSKHGLLPLKVMGTNEIMPINYDLKIPSAQVKSSIIFSAITSRGKTTILERTPTRDNTEKMLKDFGADIETEKTENGNVITINGFNILKGKDIDVPADPSSASFLVAAGLIIKNSELTIKNISMNLTRIGFFKTVEEMGANIKYKNYKVIGGEDVADIIVKSSSLKGIEINEERAASMIDEYPILSVVAAFAKGKTVMKGLSELKVKESNRLQGIIDGLNSCGVKTKNGIDEKTKEDWLEIMGESENVQGGGDIKTNLDHRIAMSFLVMGLASSEKVKIDDGSVIETSFPGFIDLIKNIGGKIA